MSKPREFWLEMGCTGRVEMIHRQDPYLLYGHAGIQDGYKNAVHVREVPADEPKNTAWVEIQALREEIESLKTGTIYIELIHQRSVAFDEARDARAELEKYKNVDRGMCKIEAEEFEKLASLMAKNKALRDNRDKTKNTILERIKYLNEGSGPPGKPTDELLWCWLLLEHESDS